VSYFSKAFDNKVTELLKNGGVGVLPTDTIYGLSALALNKDAVERIHKLKARDEGKPLVVLIAEVGQLIKLGLKTIDAELIKDYWPASLSVEFDATNAPQWLHRGGNFFAVRMPDNNVLRSLISKVGPIVSTSANLQGQVPAKNVKEAQKYFGDKLDFYIDAGKLNGEPSTLVKIENGQIIIVRQGSYKIFT
jgi:L-threonylcarbamoyladenylate synthase